MDKEKIEFLDLKRRTKTILKKEKENKSLQNSTKSSFSKNATNPIMGAFLEFTAAKKFDIEDL